MASSSSAPNKNAGTGFPAGAAIAVACTAAVLMGWHFWKRAPGHGGMPPSVFREAFALHLRQKPAVKEGKAPLNGVQGTLNSPTPEMKPGARPPISDVFVDDAGALDPFFAALWHLEQAKSGAPKTQEPSDLVTVLHYGDSPTTADLITGDARALLQERFGDAGHGFNLPAKPWAWYGHRDVAISDSGWKASTPVGSMREGVYGLGGATLVGGVGAKSRFKLADAAQGAVELSYFDEPGGGSFEVSADGNALEKVPTASKDDKSDVPTFTTVKLPAGTKEVALEVTTGTVKMLGADFRKGNSGVLYDSMGLNGATTSVMARGFGKATWPVELAHAKPAMVVINYGTNESSFAAWVNKGYEGELRMAVAKLRAALPDIPILIMSPMDRGERAGLNDIQTMATIPQIVAIQKSVAADLHCGFFDTYDAMGGDGTMAAWYNGKPRLVSADLIHPTPAGALIVAKALVSNLMLGYDRWKRAHDIAVTPATAGTPAVVSPAGTTVGRPATPAVPPAEKTGGEAGAKNTTGAATAKKVVAKKEAPAPEGATQPKDTKEEEPDVPATAKEPNAKKEEKGEAPAMSPKAPHGAPKAPKEDAPKTPKAEPLKTPDGKTPDTRS